MNINIEVYKNSLHMTDQQTINAIKKSKYILSKLETQKQDIITLSLGNLIIDKFNNDKIFNELKKLINMIIYLIQIDKLCSCVLCIDSLIEEEHFRSIMSVIKFSYITNKFKIITKTLNDDNFLIDYPEFNVEIGKKTDIIFNKRYILDLKQEYVCREDIEGEKDVR